MKTPPVSSAGAATPCPKEEEEVQEGMKLLSRAQYEALGAWLVGRFPDWGIGDVGSAACVQQGKSSAFIVA